MASGLWGLTEKQLEQAFLKGFGDWDDSLVSKPGSTAMVAYQPPEQDDFLKGFWSDDPPKSGKADTVADDLINKKRDVLKTDLKKSTGNNQSALKQYVMNHTQGTILPELRLESQFLNSKPYSVRDRKNMNYAKTNKSAVAIGHKQRLMNKRR